MRILPVSFFILVAGLVATGPNMARAEVVITGHGLFADCDAAFEYRDGALFRMLDGAFANYDADVETRIQETIAMFEKHRSDAEAAYAAADNAQKQRIALTVGKWIFLDLMGRIGKLPDELKVGYTDLQIDIYNQVIATSAGLKVEIAASIATGDPTDDILSDQATGVMLDILGNYLGPVGAFLTGAAKTSVDVAIDYWETQPIKDVAAQDVMIFARAIEKMHARSKNEKISEINLVKNQIDAACVN